MAGRPNQSKPFLFTDEQEIKLLTDQAIFSDSMAARTRAVNQLALNHGSKAISALEEIIQTIPASEGNFRAVCQTTLVKLRYAESRNAGVANSGR